MKAAAVIHPGTLLAPLILEPCGLSQSVLARQLGFNQPQPVNELIKGKRGITPKMALLLERLTGGEYPAEFWLLAQMRWDLQQAKQNLPPARLAIVERIPPEGDALEAAQQAGFGDLLEASAQLRA